MSGPVTRKRARLSSDDGDAVARDNTEQASGELPAPSPASSRTRDEEFWYDDGNIILIARDVEFRIYRGILAEKSPVFSDMFSLPQPPAASLSAAAAVADGSCPVVHLSDSSEDIRHVLRAFMPKNDMRCYRRLFNRDTQVVSNANSICHAASSFRRTPHFTRFLPWSGLDIVTRCTRSSNRHSLT